MFGKKTKTESAPVPERRQVQRGGTPQAFSYYSNRVVEPRQTRSQPRSSEGKKSDKQEQKPKTQRSFLASLPLWLLLIVIIVCVVKILVLSSSPKIIVVGKSSVTANYTQSNDVYASAAHKLLASSITNHTKLTVNTNGVTQSLKREFPELVDVSMSIPLISNRPVVYVQPAMPTLVLQNGSSNYALNESGVVLAQLDSLPSGIPTIVDQSGIAPEPGKQVLPSGTVAFVQTVAYQLTAAHLAISTFILPAGSPYELDVRLEGRPYDIRFNLEADSLTQSGAAIATIGQLGSTVPSSYIDVRVPNRVYYK
jgi:hypothetical protein